MGELKAEETEDLIAKLKGEKSVETKVQPIEEIEVDEEYDFEEDEEKEALPKNKQKKEDYSEVVEAMPELKQDLDYLLVINKIKNNEKCSAKELEFKEVYEEAKRKEQEFIQAQEIKMHEEEIRQKELQEQINKEYEEQKAKHPETIETYDSHSLSMKGSDNFLKVASTFMAFKKSKKKGGKIFVKVARPKKVSFEWTTKDIKYVEFWGTNERGDKVKEVTKVTQYEYTFDGTSVPVIFAIQGFAESWDFYSEFRKDLSSEMVTGAVMEAYNLGYKDGLVLSDKKKDKGMLGALTEFMPLIMVVGFVIMIFMLWQMWDSLGAMIKAVQLMQAQMAALAPTVPVDALVVR